MRVQTTVSLNGREITYTLKRSQRKSIGLTIDHQGLHISVPMHATSPHIDAVLRQKANWITQKLDQWQNKKSLTPVWTPDASYPLLGKPWRIAQKPTGEIEMAQHLADQSPQLALTPRQIETFVMHWYQQQASACFKERIAIYAQKLQLPTPPLRLSQAKTRWGSCNNRGLISLNWRLIQLPLHLIDYVVAHELAHLIELNHSKAFWAKVESIYSGYRSARRELKGYSSVAEV